MWPTDTCDMTFEKRLTHMKRDPYMPQGTDICKRFTYMKLDLYM